MKRFGFWVLFVVVGTAFMLLAFSIISSSSGSSFPDMFFPIHGNSVKVTARDRKLKESSYNPSNEKSDKDIGKINLEDYHLIDPVPSSKAAIKSGPIEHGTPLMPYIPKPVAPSHPKRGGSPSPT